MPIFVAMAGKDLKEKAKEYLDFGMPKQQVFDMLVAEFPARKPKKIADELRFIPTLAARERYGSLHRLLLAVVLAYGALRMARPMLAPDFDWSSTARLISLAPIATLLLGYSLYRWQGQMFQWVGWMNLASAFGLMGTLTGYLRGSGEHWAMALGLLSITIGALALFLAYRVFPEYKTEKDPLGQVPPRYVFVDERPF